MGKLIQTYTTFQASVAIAAVAAGEPICQVVPFQELPVNGVGHNTVIGLTRLRVVATTAVQGAFGLIEAATPGTEGDAMLAGITIGTPVSQGNGGWESLVSLSGANPNARLVSLWTVAPTPVTIPGDPYVPYYEQDLLPATVGAGFEWTWPEDDPFTGAFNWNGSIDDTFSMFRRTTGASGPGVLLMNLNAGASPALFVTARWVQMSLSQQIY